MNKVNNNLICFGGNEPLIKSFICNEVEFILVGGLAVSWFCSSRQADDMDLLINPTNKYGTGIE